jgi:hypothetical protein
VASGVKSPAALLTDPYRTFLVIVPNSSDDIALLVPRFDVPASLGNPLQRIGPVDDRHKLARLDELFEEEQLLEFGVRAPQT